LTLLHRLSFYEQLLGERPRGGCGAAASRVQDHVMIDGPLSKGPCGGIDGVTPYGGMLPGPA